MNNPNDTIPEGDFSVDLELPEYDYTIRTCLFHGDEYGVELLSVDTGADEDGILTAKEYAALWGPNACGLLTIAGQAYWEDQGMDEVEAANIAARADDYNDERWGAE